MIPGLQEEVGGNNTDTNSRLCGRVNSVYFADGWSTVIYATYFAGCRSHEQNMIF